MTDADPREVSASPFFTVTHATDRAGPRTGCMRTAHGPVDTPCFLPIASHGSLRALSFEQAAACGSRLLMANAWYIFGETGPERLRALGGAHGWMGWSGILMTDSGGYQVFSLKENSRITDDGVVFGGDAALTPEHVVEIQRHLGSDIMLVLDDCAPYPCPDARAEEAVRRTSLWARRSMAAFRASEPKQTRPQRIYGIIQGSTRADLRRRSVDEVAGLGFDGYGIGGLSIGMPRPAIREMTALTSALLPENRPRHLLGVGLPGQILEGIADGADTFDCVLPIRKAQRGVAYTSTGERIYKRPNARPDEPLDPSCGCATCAEWSREALRRLFKSDKARAGELAAVHNLSFYHATLAAARSAIQQDRFDTFKDVFLDRWEAGET
jgi:queuine tRNA-ribosyltransferase